MQRCAIGDRVVDNIRYLRNIKKLTQHELENQAGLSLNYISGIERFNFYPRYDAIEQIAKVLEIQPYVLFMEDIEKTDDYLQTVAEIKSMFRKFEEKTKELKGVIYGLSISMLT